MVKIGTMRWLGLSFLLGACLGSPGAQERTLEVPRERAGIQRFEAVPGDDGSFTFWLPEGADAYVVPFSAGVEVDSADEAGMRWLRKGSPWELLELPLFGARYGDRTLACIVPWPHYAHLDVGERVGIRFAMPERRHRAAPCVVLAQWTGAAPLDAAQVFRDWRATVDDLGLVPARKPLRTKIEERPRVGRLLGAAHVYLWGNARFSRHDVVRRQWPAFAKALLAAPRESRIGRLVAGFPEEAGDALRRLAESEWPEEWLTRQVAASIDRAITRTDWSGLQEGPGEELDVAEVVDRNLAILAAELPAGTRPVAAWGDGISRSMLESLQRAGIDRALLLTSDLYQRGVRPDVIAEADRRGYLFGPYDSYHSVHRPGAHPDTTWETAQFDQRAFDEGRVINADGSGHGGFKGRGFHFAPAAAWPYFQKRIGGMCAQAPFTTWFVDCDATGQCFEDYHPERPTTRVDDLGLRRARLTWLATERGLVVGSEGGSVLFADVLDYGHGVDTPYIGHLDPALRDRESEFFLGGHWPPDRPRQSFDPVPVAPSLRSPYFDPRDRIPLYRAAVGDELVTSHHWSFDSLKLSDVAGDRELLELFYMTPPMYHVSRSAWPERRARIARHYAFFSPLHRRLATAPLVDFEPLSSDRLLQRVTYRTLDGDVVLTANFAAEERGGFPARSLSVEGLELEESVYRVR